MRNFKKIVPRILVILLFLWGINKIGQFCFESAKDNLPMTLADIREHQGTVETLFVGTSLTHVGMDINVISEELDTVGFNLGTSAQPLAGSYYLVRDQISRNPIERVFLGVSVNAFVSDTDNRSTVAKVRVLRQILSPVGKAQFLLASASADDLESLLFTAARVDHVLNLSYVIKNIKFKLSQDFDDRISYRAAEYNYYGMGYESSDAEFDGEVDAVKDNNFWDREKILEGNVSYIRKTAAYCEKKGVEFNLVVFPHSQNFSALQGDLADMDAYLEELAEEIGADLYNYNYTARPDIYEYLPDNYYMDAKHLNYKGAAEMAHLLAEDYKKS